MDPLKKGENPGDFGKIIDTLHNKQKLPSLRTYQGDMAEFIKEKNESVVSIAVKQKEKKERIEKEEEKLKPVVKSKSEKGGFRKNLIIVFLSLVLLVGGVAVSFYIFNSFKKEPVSQVVAPEKIIPYNNLITLTDVTSENFGSEITKLSPSNGVNILKISSEDGLSFETSKDFFNLLEVSLPATLKRTLKDDYAIGIISQNNQTSYFLIITISDFGQAFSGMLDWESSMEKDLSFLNVGTNSFITANTTPNIPADTVATSTASSTSTGTNTVAKKPLTTTASSSASTTLNVKIPMKPDNFSWKDMIVKNKDTRALVNQKDQAKIAYTFLDKNTILITSSLSSIGDIYTIYASRSIVR
jgi:hypothetical protein